jgi:uncharacterized protein (DUF433 family)
MGVSAGLEPAYTLPLYTQPEVARIVDVPERTLRNWARGYVYKTLTGMVEALPLITTSEPRGHRLQSVPFVGLAEAYVLAAFRAAGVPMQRIRPAIAWLDENIGLPAALASERLLTDGAEILYDFGQRAGNNDPETARIVADLVVIRNQQRVFVPIVHDYLRTVTYQNGWVELIHLPQYEEVDVIVDPRINFGKPTVAARGVRVTDILSRIQAGEAPSAVAWDYGLRPEEVAALTQRAA